MYISQGRKLLRMNGHRGLVHFQIWIFSGSFRSNKNTPGTFATLDHLIIHVAYFRINTQRHNPQDHDLKLHLRGYLKSPNVSWILSPQASEYFISSSSSSSLSFKD
jgi:hypothetical protein